MKHNQRTRINREKVRAFNRLKKELAYSWASRDDLITRVREIVESVKP